jgi:hypothetical protein
VDIGFEQRQTHLAQGGIHLRLVEHAAPRDPLENFLQPAGKGFKHIGSQKRRPRLLRSGAGHPGKCAGIVSVRSGAVKLLPPKPSGNLYQEDAKKAVDNQERSKKSKTIWIR